MVSKKFKKATAYCELHGKWLYARKSQAKSVARQHTDAHMNVYRCDRVPHMFHIGHLAQSVLEGDASRRDVYGKGDAAA